ncbi:MAG: phosphate ABC transporter substrate-binding/OmpA family protein [Acidobacteriota bacterium]
MKRSTLGALLLLVLGAIAIVGWYFLRDQVFDWGQRRTSDATGVDVTVTIGGDNYLGYWFITSPEMRKQAAQRGIGVQFTDDGGAYSERLAKFAAGEYDAIVLPVNSYLQHGAAVQFPGVIVASIAESQGADGMVGFSDSLPSGKLEDLNDAELQVVYTGASPSEFLLDLTIADFDLDELRGGNRWRVEAGSSRDVYKRAQNNQGDVFVLWEPDLSRALSLPGMTYVWGSDRFSGYIVDVFVFRRDFLADEPEAAVEFLRTYFRVLTSYANNRDKLIKEIRQSTDLDEEAIRGILDKIEWFDLEENRRLQFGIERQPGEQVNDGIINTIISCTDVMLRTERLTSDPLEGNPYLITNSSVLEELVASGGPEAVIEAGAAEVVFEALEPADWQRLREVGTFRVEPITFQSWNNQLADDGKESVDKISQLLTHHYRGYRIIIRGHTGPGGDEAANVQLSLERAQAVLQYLKAVHGIAAERLLAEGMGSTRPPRRKPGESPRAYQYRLSRVEFTAVEANPL